MKRELYVSTPSVQQLNITAPVNKGGTGGTTSAEVAVSLGGVLTASIGQPNGPVKQEVGGGVAKAALPSAVPLGATMDGPQDFYVGSTNTLTITNYDANTSYAVSATAGTISINGNAITFVAPGTPQSVTLTIGGRQVTANVIALTPIRPQIIVPTYGAVNQAIDGLQIQGNALTIPSGTPSHQQSDWQISTTADFSVIAQSSLNDTVNKTTWTVSGLSYSTIYYVRVRYKDTNLGYSNWSNGDKFTTAAFNGVVTEEAKLVSSTPVAGAQGAIIVRITADGTRVAYGAWRDSAGSLATAGSMYIFVRSGTTWVQEAKFFPADIGSGDTFGRNCDITPDGSRVIISSYSANVNGSSGAGAAYVFSRSGSTWTQEQKLISNAQVANARFGNSVGISSDGTRVAVGASSDTATGTTTAGAVYIYLRTGTTWTLEQKMVASDKTSGWSLGIQLKLSADGTRVAVGSVGATFNGVTSGGAVYIYLRSGTTWTQEAKIGASDAVGGSQFGAAIAATTDFTRLVVGASGAANGSSYVYTRSGTVWAQEAKLVASDGASGDGFGTGVAITDDGSTVYVGAWAATVAAKTLSGAMYSFTRSGTTWTQKSKFNQSDTLQGARYGTDCAVTPDGTRLVVGAINASVGAVTTAGAAYVVR